MADDSDVVDYESELAQQIEVQRAALSEIQEALEFEPSEELTEVKCELEAAIRELESALLEMKRERLSAMLNGVQEAQRLQGEPGPSSSCHNPSKDQQRLRTPGSQSFAGQPGTSNVSEEGSDEEEDVSDGRGEDDGEWDEPEAAAAEEEEGHHGLGLDVFVHARLAAEAGIQTDTAHFADWEVHSRGIASKLLAGMGYVKGGGLGRLGNGTAAPIIVELLPQRLGLGGADLKKRKVSIKAGHIKKKKRGGERSRRKKEAARVRDGRDEEEEEEQRAELTKGPSAAGLFSFINSQLGDNSEAAEKLKAVEAAMLRGIQPEHGKGRFRGQTSQLAARGQKKDDRHTLMKQGDQVAACEAKVSHFKAMLERNRENSKLAKQVTATLEQAHRELGVALAEQARIRQAITGKEAKEKFWGKF